MGKEEDGGWGGAIRELGQLSIIGLQLVLSTVIGLAVGLYLDRRFGTKPVLMLIFLGLGLGAGFVNIFRIALRNWKERDP